MLIDIVINSLHQVMEFLGTDLKCNFCDRFQHQMHSLDGSIGQPWIEDLVFAKLLGLYSYFHSNQTWPFIFYTARSRTENCCNNRIHNTKYKLPASIFMTVIIASALMIIVHNSTVLCTVPCSKTQRSFFSVWLAVSSFRITLGWKIWGVPKNLGNSHDDGHWNFPIWTKGSWVNGDKRFQLAYWNHVNNHLFSQSVTQNNRLCFGGLQHLQFWVIFESKGCFRILKLCDYHQKWQRK